MTYLGKMDFKQFAALAQALRAPVIERTETIGEYNTRFNYAYVPDTQIYFKCDNVRSWVYVPLSENVKTALEAAKVALTDYSHILPSQIAGRCAKRL